MITIKYGWDLINGKFQRAYEEEFKTEEEAVKWVNKLMIEIHGEGAKQYETLS